MKLDTGLVKAIFFDIDGTLRDTDDEVIAKGVRLFGPALGRDRTRRLMRRLVMAMETPTQALLGAADRVYLDGPLNRLIDYLALHGPTQAVPGTIEMIRRLEGNYRLGVVSAGPRGAVQRFLVEHDLDEVMEVVVVGTSYRRTKPHPMPIIEAARTLGIHPSAVLMVGDTTVDIKAGRRAGAQTLGVLSGFGRRSDLEREHADLIAESAAELSWLMRGGVPPAITAG